MCIRHTILESINYKLLLREHFIILLRYQKCIKLIKKVNVYRDKNLNFHDVLYKRDKYLSKFKAKFFLFWNVQ